MGVTVLLRLVFTSDKVVVGVIIRSVERQSWKQNTDSAYGSVAYDQVKTALLE